MPEDGLDLAGFLPYRLSRLANGISRRLADLYAQRFDLTPAQWRVMAVLGQQPGLTADEITDRTGMDKVAVSRAVARLRGRRYLLSRTPADDARRRLLRLSAEGARCYRKIVPLAREFEARLLRSLTPGDQAHLERAIDALTGALEGL